MYNIKTEPRASQNIHNIQRMAKNAQLIEYIGTIRACTYEIISTKKPAGNIDTVLTVCRRTVNLLFPFWFQNLYNKIKPSYFDLFI